MIDECHGCDRRTELRYALESAERNGQPTLIGRYCTSDCAAADGSEWDAVLELPVSA